MAAIMAPVGIADLLPVLATVYPEDIGLLLLPCSKAFWLNRDFNAAIQTQSALRSRLLFGCCKSTTSTVERLRVILACRRPLHLSATLNGLSPIQIAIEQRKYDFVLILSGTAGVDLSARWPKTNNSILLQVAKQAAQDDDERAYNCAFHLASLRCADGSLVFSPSSEEGTAEIAGDADGLGIDGPVTSMHDPPKGTLLQAVCDAGCWRLLEYWMQKDLIPTGMLSKPIPVGGQDSPFALLCCVARSSSAAGVSDTVADQVTLQLLHPCCIKNNDDVGHPVFTPPSPGTSSAETPQAKPTLLHMACKRGMLQAMLYWKRQDERCLDELVGVKDRDGHTPFSAACEAGTVASLRCASMLIRLPTFKPEEKAGRGASHFAWACRGGLEVEVEHWLQTGVADKTLVQETDEVGNTAYFEACGNTSKDMLASLVPARPAHKAIILSLVRTGWVSPSVSDSEGASHLLWTCLAGAFDAVLYWLKHDRSGVDAALRLPTPAGFNPPFRIVCDAITMADDCLADESMRTTAIACAKLLGAQPGCSPAAPSSSDGLPSFFVAAAVGLTSVLSKWLRDPTLTRKIVDRRDSNGRTAFGYLCGWYKKCMSERSTNLRALAPSVAACALVMVKSGKCSMLTAHNGSPNIFCAANAGLEDAVGYWSDGADVLGAIQADMIYKLVTSSKNSTAAAYDKAMPWLISAAQAGYAPSQSRLASCFESGRGVPQNHAMAAAWYAKAADNGDVPARVNLGHLHYKGLGVRKNYTEAARLYREAAKEGEETAYIPLGDMYFHGHGVDKDGAKAVKIYKKAAESGKCAVEASKRLAEIYYKGLGVSQDHAKAARWYVRPAEANDVACQLRLAYMYFTGKGVAKDYAQAAVWFRRAALGNGDAQFAMGRMYENGQGVEIDVAQAVQWYKKSASQGQSHAQAALQRLQR